MEFGYDKLIYLMANLFRVFSINLFFEGFFSRDNLRCSKVFNLVVLAIYYVVNSCIYLFYDNQQITLISNIALFVMLTLPYRATVYKRLFGICCIFLIGMLCETVVSGTAILVLGQIDAVAVITYTLSNFLFYIVVIISKNAFGREEYIYRRGRAAVLIAIPAISSFMDFLIIYGGYEQWITAAVIFCLFLINFAFFYLYKAVVMSCKAEMQNRALSMQNKAYKQQLDTIQAAEDNLRRARHDFKNHLIALEEMTKTDEKTELTKKYFEKLDREYNSSEKDVYTGNKILDGLINNKLATVRSGGVKPEIRMEIPEDIDIDTFDMVIVIGNLMDNAIEALERTEEKIFRLEMRYDKGIIYIITENSYNGEIIKNGDTFVSIKTNEKGTHGIGLSNIKRIVSEHNGEIDIETDNNIFTVSIIMYL